MDSELLSYKLLEELEQIKLQSKNILEQSYKSIEVCRNLLSTIKKEVTANKFDSIEAEIHFFKDVKQFPLVHLIYYSEIHSFEIQFPKADKKAQLKFIKKKIGKLNRFFLYNIDFGQYVNSNATHFDKEYYTRDYLDTYHITTSKFYFQDPDFSTPRDMLLGKFKAYNSLVTYLDERMFSIKTNSKGKSLNPTPTEKIAWPFSNTDWAELIYALWFSGLRQKGLSIIQVSQKLHEVFDRESTDIYKSFADMKNRKHSRTLFLDRMVTSLLFGMDKSEE